MTSSSSERLHQFCQMYRAIKSRDCSPAHKDIFISLCSVELRVNGETCVFIKCLFLSGGCLCC